MKQNSNPRNSLLTAGIGYRLLLVGLLIALLWLAVGWVLW
ncbi:hypothetical protein Thini_0981 [Thiothrix nivea DSM 5205]|uniref:Uncharacterized protein n=1 Tax=Thiothrix nivea (strain ATCC 35100 / DSM 5205 / JP2) TaxID=870187 RepID=A0A656HDS4_THINJ|nr:hypothetical protein Thini_0981 [Thiothrix nivea DSM 5205]